MLPSIASPGSHGTDRRGGESTACEGIVEPVGHQRLSGVFRGNAGPDLPGLQQETLCILVTRFSVQVFALQVSRLVTAVVVKHDAERRRLARFALPAR